MILTIHRGTHQIGGCVTELRSGGSRIFIDLGSRLPGADGVTPEEDLSLPGVTEPGPPCDGVLFTHSHGDHMGQLGRILPHVPIWMGPATQEIQLLLNRHLDQAPALDRGRELAALDRARTYEYGKSIQVGGFRVTPYYTDHSAFDAAMLKIEAEGLTLLHTGDFRLHGPKGKGTLPALQSFVGQVDYLLCEGTMLSRPGEKVLTEGELRRKAAKIMGLYPRVFVHCSSTNIDRIASFCAACPVDRPMLCDSYQADVLAVAERYSTSGFYHFPKLYIVGSQAVNPKLDAWIREKGALIFLRTNDWGKRMLREYAGDGSVVIYSQWGGYLDGPAKIQAYIELLEGQNVVRLHTSGHATTEALKQVCDAVEPRRAVIPLHTERPEGFRALFPDRNVVVLRDGQMMEL